MHRNKNDYELVTLSPAERRAEKDADYIQRLIGYIAEHPGTSWAPAEQAVKGVGKKRRATLRDKLLKEGRLRDSGGTGGRMALEVVVPEAAATVGLAAGDPPAPAPGTAPLEGGAVAPGDSPVAVPGPPRPRPPVLTP